MSTWNGTGKTDVSLLPPRHPSRRRTTQYYVVRTLCRIAVYTLLTAAFVALTSEWSFIR